MVLVGSVQGGVEGRLIGIYLQDRPPRVIRAGSVDLFNTLITFRTYTNDLLDVLVGYPMELQEELPRLHVTLDQLRSRLLELFLLLGVHCLHLLSVLAFLIGLLYLVKSPQFLVVHYSLDHCLDRERFFADALEELVAEPTATIVLPVLSDRPELTDSEVRVVHKLLIRRPDTPLAFRAAFHRPLFFDIEHVDLFHSRKVHNVFRTYCYPSEVLLLVIVKPLLELSVDGY